MTPRLFRLLLWVQWRSLLARIRTLRKRSPLLPFLLVGFVLGYLLLGYFLFHAGLRFLFGFPVVGALLSQRILFLIFGFFFVMLVFSNLIIGYSTLFKNRETNWFLTLPIPHADVYRWKLLECLVVSSWALIFLSAPMMAAFGQVNQAEPVFYAQTALIYLPFVVLPAVLGSALVLTLVAVLSNPWAQRGILLAAGVAVLSALIFGRPATGNELGGHSEAHTFEGLLRHTRFSLNAFLPSAWMARAVLAWSGGLAREGTFFCALLLSNALLGLLLGFEVASRFFYESWARAFSHRSERSQRKAGARRQGRLAPSWLERALRLLPRRLLGAPTRALVVKDARVFWRDPAQWTQVMIFFGLLTIYVLNLRNVAYDFRSPFWSTMISYLNHRLLAHAFDAHHAFRFPAVQPRRAAVVDHRARPARAAARGDAKILDRVPRRHPGHGRPHGDFQPHPQAAPGHDRVFCRGHRRHERRAVRPLGGPGRAVPQF